MALKTSGWTPAKLSLANVWDKSPISSDWFLESMPRKAYLTLSWFLGMNRLMSMERAFKIKGVGFLLLCSLSWGPAYLFIKIAVPEIPPITLVFLRVGIAWAILYPVCLIQTRRSFDWKRYWKHYLILAVTLNALPFCLVSFGELYISSAL